MDTPLRTVLSAMALSALCLLVLSSITHPQNQSPILPAPEETALVLPMATAPEPTPIPEPAPAPEPAPEPAPLYRYEAGTLAAVNFQSLWGDKEANLASMTDYITQAASQGVELLVFPELCLSGYVLCNDPTLWDYQMPIALAESIDGPTAATISALAQQHNMWIIYGATETAPGNQAYNAAFVCAPDGTVETYRKLAPVEGDWCASGDTPLIVDAGDLGRIGIGVCYDTYAHPELSHYYQAMDCDLYINLTASMVNYTDDYQKAWLWYYTTRLESILAQTDMAIISANLVDSCSWRDFPGGSVIADDTTDVSVTTQTPGLVVNQTPLAYYNAPTVSTTLAPSQIATWYQTIAQSGNNPKFDYSTSVAPTVTLANADWTTLDQFQNTDILLLPDNGTVQPIPGSLTQALSTHAQAQQLYILCAMTQTDIQQDDTITYTPTVVIISPDGTVQQCDATQTAILQTPWGDFGIAQGDTLYTLPLLSRYYGAMGCKGILHMAEVAPTAFEVETLLSTYVHRDGLAVASCSPTSGHLLTPYHTSSGIQSVNWGTGSGVNIASAEGNLLEKTWSLQDTGFAISYFHATTYANWFEKINEF